MSTSNVPNPGAGPSNAGQTAPQQQPLDSVNRVRALVWQLKEVLSNLMKITANGIGNVPETGSKSGDGKCTRFDKPLEEFFSICNQIELHLKTIGECVIQHRDGQKYVPFNVNLKSEITTAVEPPTDNSLSYSQYLNTIKGQINYCKQVQEILSEGVRKINQMETIPQQQSQ